MPDVMEHKASYTSSSPALWGSVAKCPIVKVPPSVSAILLLPSANSLELRLSFEGPHNRGHIDFLIAPHARVGVTVVVDGRPIGHVDCRDARYSALPVDSGGRHGTTIQFIFSKGIGPEGGHLPLHRVEYIPEITPDIDARRTCEPLPDQSTLTDAKIASAFINLGENCELGIVQRHVGREPPDLYRFSAVPLAWILFGLAEQYADINVEHEVTLDNRPDGHVYYYAYQPRYHIQFETGIRCDHKPADDMMRESRQRMDYMSTRLMTDLAEGFRIPVYSTTRRFSTAEITALSLRLALYGPACALVVYPAHDTEETGKLQWVADNVLVGSLDALAHHACVIDTVDDQSWLNLLRRAHDEVRLHRHALSCLPDDFSGARYLEINKDVDGWHGSAARHYVEYGQAEGRAYR
ncbi:hypothetical protein AA103196_0779 [Ameyamaea chiangmaiensis NBRC 103196]|uniref:Uncharacterized protein n=1 Tax=Ameyamaea chiangmaiensis TaxID=442969 RepID=A0A850PIY4_9PROT|nr:hypothetical protein [Ameyamaea chiangmaiensis]MBS4075882.1 hypothetical protein [Ameyamaea chiangmaiensis]NVN41231.1 hypothetical protein [Ameyamaea chiangmaiensis]GBQ64088.1 hypothetical protein AA103196_0779 [Ameyamaea chiangmaiensis NBRC 103196]